MTTPIPSAPRILRAAEPLSTSKFQSQALLVLGMHRSGTSALTRVISLLGATLPSDLAPPVPNDNELGFWESLAIIEVHDALLEAVNSEWHDVSPVPPSFFESPVARTYQERMLQILRRDFSSAPLFVLKDPRMCRLVPFWTAVLERFEAEPLFVLPVRNPLEVAASLKARNHFPVAKSAQLWLRHILDAERDTRTFKRSVVTYDLLLRDWRAAVDRISKDLKITWPNLSHMSSVEIEASLSTQQRHFVISDTEVKAHHELVEWINRGYSCMQRLAEAPNDVVLEELDVLRGEVELADQAYGPLLAYQRRSLIQQQHKLATQRNEKAGLEQALGSLQVELDQRGQAVAIVTAERNAVQVELDQRGQAVAIVTAERDQARGTLEERERRLQAMQVELDQRGEAVAVLTAERDQVRAALELRERRLEALQADLAQRGEALGIVTAERNEARGTLEALQRRLEALQVELAQRGQAVAIVTAERDHARGDRDERQRRLEALQADLAQRGEALGIVTAERDQARQAMEERERRLEALERDLELLRAQLQTMASENDQARATLAERGKQLAALQAELALRGQAVVGLTVERDQARAALAERGKQLEEMQAGAETAVLALTDECDKARTRLSEQEQRLQEAQATASALTGERDAAQAKLAEEGRRVQAMSVELTERGQAVAVLSVAREQLQAELEQRDKKQQAMDVELTERGHAVAVLTAERNLAQDALARQSRQVRDLEFQLTATKTSLPWRLSWPLRALDAVLRATARGLRRRRHALEILPYQNVEPARAEEGYAWRATSQDPAFALQPAHGRLPGGWLLLAMRLSQERGVASPKLYLDTGLGFSEEEAYVLPLPVRERLVTILHMPPLVQALRFDPAEQTGLLSLEQGRLIEITRLEAMLRIGWRVLRRARRQGRNWTSLIRQALQLSREGRLRLHVKQVYFDKPEMTSASPEPAAVEAGDEFVPEAAAPSTTASVKLIAFYLPQFHPIPENDQWWGKGFTEWTNVMRGTPQFEGHYQPKLPGELGFYDLRVREVQQRQIELARKYGIYGFCYHHYWFGGKRLLEKPFRQVLADAALDLPFCLCWANENWTRRWDGQESEVLMAQSHSHADDLAFIKEIEPALKDPRYIRIGGRPLLLVYRASILPDAKATAQRWRDYCRSAGIGDLYLVAAQTFGIDDPRPYGFDAAVQFPPHGLVTGQINERLRFTRADFGGRVFDYQEIARFVPAQKDFRLYPTVMPAWDNVARRGHMGHVFHGSTPRAYQRWLREAAEHVLSRHPPEERLVFINAWNEWAEGAYLEPDRRYGYAYLQATANAIAEDSPLVSVIMPAYNHERFITAALESVAHQTYRNIELIVVDDGSTDGTGVKIREFAAAHEELAIRMALQENAGTHKAILRGMEMASGSYIAVINSDDVFAPERIEHMLAEMRAKGAEFSFSDVSFVDDDGREAADNEIAARLKAKLEAIHKFSSLEYALLDSNVAISSGNFLFTRALYDRLGGFSALKLCHDWDFALQASLLTPIARVNEVLYHYRIHRQNSFRDLHDLSEIETREVLRKYFAALSNGSNGKRRMDDPYLARFIQEHGYQQYL